METLLTEEEQTARRNFYLNLSPQLGQHFANQIGGFPVPSAEVQEHESIDVAKLFLLMAHTGAMEHMADTSWWMLNVMDPTHRLDRVESNLRSDQLVSFAISTIRGLMEKGVLTWGKPVPELDLSGAQRINPKLDDVDKDVIKRMEEDLTSE